MRQRDSQQSLGMTINYVDVAKAVYVLYHNEQSALRALLCTLAFAIYNVTDRTSLGTLQEIKMQ